MKFPMGRRRILINLFLALALVPSMYAAEFTTYTNTRNITCMERAGKIIYAGTDGGLVIWDRNTFNIVKLTTVDGLPDNYIQCVTADGLGRIYIGTRNGLGIGDDSGWSIFDNDDGEASNDILSLAVRNNSVFAGTSGGLYIFSGGEWSILAAGSDTLPGPVQALAPGRGDTLWIGSGSGLYIYNGAFHDASYIHGALKSGVHAIYADSAGETWIGTAEGVLWLDDEEQVFYDTGDGLPASAVYSLAMDRNGIIWAGTAEGAASFGGGSWTALPQIRNAGRVAGILTDENGVKYFGTQDGVRYMDGTLCPLSGINEISSNFVRAIDCGRDGTMWVGTDGGGLNEFDGVQWTVHDTSGGLADNSVWAVKVAVNGTVWVGTYGGINARDGESWASYTGPGYIPNNRIRCIAEDANGVMWFGTYGGGATSFDGNLWETYTTARGLAFNRVWAIAEEREGVLWFGTALGLSRFNGSGWKTYLSEDGLSDTWIRALAFDGTGSLWVGTYNGGVCAFDGDSWTAFGEEDGLADNRVLAIAAGKDGMMWIGTANGLSRFDGDTWKSYTTRDGLANNYVNALDIDEAGTLRIGMGSIYGGGGVSVYKPEHATAIRGDGNRRESNLSLMNYPNPFNAGTVVRFSLPFAGAVHLSIYSIAGSHVKTLVRNDLAEGMHEFIWDGTNAANLPVSSGIYFIRLGVKDEITVRKILLLR